MLILAKRLPLYFISVFFLLCWCMDGDAVKGHHCHNLAMMILSPTDKNSYSEGYIRTYADRKPVMAGEEEWEEVKTVWEDTVAQAWKNNRAKEQSYLDDIQLQLFIYHTDKKNSRHLFIWRAAPEASKYFPNTTNKNILRVCACLSVCIQFGLMTEGFSDSSRNKTEGENWGK